MSLYTLAIAMIAAKETQERGWERMNEYVYLRPHNLLVDRCPRGHGVYLEAKEIERVLAVASNGKEI